MAPALPALRDVKLDDKYELESGRVYLTGAQAFVRLLMLQRQRDKLAGLNTGGFVSGYRGSPLGALDQSLWKAKKFLDRANVMFQPGLNEDLAATSIWGTQQLNLHAGAKVDGVFAMWYGKGPGVDRCGDVFKHANMAGTSKHGGVLVLAGDDHAAKSSTVPHQSDHQFSAAMMPVLYPSSVQEILDLGLHGWAMSRYSGCWVGFKCVADTVESSSSVYVDPARTQIVVPDDFPLPPDGVSIRWPDAFLDDRSADAGLQDLRGAALLPREPAEPRRHRLARSRGSASRRPARATRTSGRRSTTSASPTPTPPRWACACTRSRCRGRSSPKACASSPKGLDEILVVEEKRQIVEYQLKEQLYNWRDDVRPRVVGKFDEKGEWVRPHGDWLLPAAGELTPAMIARVIAKRIERLELQSAAPGAAARARGLDQREGSGAREAEDRPRPPAVLLLGLPAQHVDAPARRQPRDGGHRLPRDGDLDGPQHVRVHAHGRRRRDVDRPGAVHRREAHLRRTWATARTTTAGSSRSARPSRPT